MRDRFPRKFDVQTSYKPSNYGSGRRARAWGEIRPMPSRVSCLANASRLAKRKRKRLLRRLFPLNLSHFPSLTNLSYLLPHRDPSTSSKPNPSPFFLLLPPTPPPFTLTPSLPGYFKSRQSYRGLRLKSL